MHSKNEFYSWFCGLYLNLMEDKIYEKIFNSVSLFADYYSINGV